MPLENQSKINPERVLRIVFLGTGEFAIPTLKMLLNSHYQLLAVVTKCDMPAGRGLKEIPTPVKIFLQEYSPRTTVLQPASLRDEGFLDEAASFQADLFVVACFPIMPKKLVNLPRIGCLNLHPSLLPRYRGAAPIRWALINGETETGVSVFFIGDKVDAGSILLQRPMEIAPDENYGSLHDRLAEMGAQLAAECLDLIAGGDFPAQPQNESLASPAPKITLEHMRIDWKRSANDINNQIRAFFPAPGAFTSISGKRFKIFQAKPLDLMQLAPGKGIIEKDRMLVGCGIGTLELLEVQIEGKKRRAISQFLCGFRQQECEFE